MFFLLFGFIDNENLLIMNIEYFHWCFSYPGFSVYFREASIDTSDSQKKSENDKQPSAYMIEERLQRDDAKSTYVVRFSPTVSHDRHITCYKITPTLSHDRHVTSL